MSFGSGSVFWPWVGHCSDSECCSCLEGWYYGDTRCKGVEWCQVVGFCWYGL